MKITKIVIDPSQIGCILKKIGWPTTTPEFDEPQDLVEWDICQLALGTEDGFPEECKTICGPDPPECYFEDNIDPPHWEDSNFIQYDKGQITE